ncbi:hypothetical protein SKAU_G00009680 [Synaphobranchus kaupii]|uniref:Uncharacterized protein n=1 Tax=Synaphobranchus kaupii TaxID=118154 RepID=A0A9Q1JCU0_SYNKA|nr:hypothetical protein SKAU_G00009680 [Synaphobranchus kaupii]
MAPAHIPEWGNNDAEWTLKLGEVLQGISQLQERGLNSSQFDAAGSGFVPWACQKTLATQRVLQGDGTGPAARPRRRYIRPRGRSVNTGGGGGIDASHRPVCKQ